MNGTQAHFEVFQGENDDWYWRLKAGNGEIIAQSEVNGTQAHFEVFQGENDDWYWRLKAGNGEIIAQSEGYTSSQHAYDGAKTVKREAAYAVTADIRTA